MENKDCGKCGRCCEAIQIGYSKQGLLDKFGPDHYDTNFIVENWEEMTEEEFSIENPFFYNQLKDIRKDSEDRKESYFYKCNKFNSKTRLCNAYETRPDVCKNFPFYPLSSNKVIDGERMLHPTFALYSENCAFVKARATWEQWNKDSNELTKEV